MGEHAQSRSLNPADIALPEQVPPLVDGHKPFQRRFLTSTLCLLIDLFSVTAQHYGRTLNEIDRLAGDEALKKSIQQYTIHVDDIIVPVYRREMEAPIEDMKRFLDGLLHIFDKGRTRVDTVYLYNILHDAQVRLNAANDSVAP